MKKIYKISGLDCVSCKVKLEQALGQIKGVKASVDLETGITSVEMPDSVTDKAILAKISEAGFDAVVI